MIVVSDVLGGIINFILKMGENELGSVLIMVGFDYDFICIDFEYGMYLNDSVCYYIGGFVC